MVESTSRRRLVLWAALVLVLLLGSFAVPASRAQDGADWQEAIDPPASGSVIGLDGPIAFYTTFDCRPPSAGTVKIGASLLLHQRVRACGRLWYEVQLEDGSRGWLPIALVDDGGVKRQVQDCRYSGGNGGKVDPYRSPTVADEHIWVAWAQPTLRDRDLVHIMVDLADDERGPFFSWIEEVGTGPYLVDLRQTVPHPETGRWTVWVFANDVYVGGCWFELEQ